MNNFISISEETANRLLHTIVVEKKYLPGERLPNEKELSQALSVSRTSLREAVKILISSGVLEIKRGVGTFVTATPALSSSTFLDLCAEENKYIAMEALQIRLILEPSMAKIAVMNATESEKLLICKYEEECRNVIESERNYTYEDHLFHKSVAAASHNLAYEKLLPILHSSISIILRSTDFMETAHKSAQNALIYHKMLADCILNGDIKGAELAAKTHIYNAIEYLKEYF